MPRYQVTLDGKTFVVEGDRPPTEAEARGALASYKPAEVAKPAGMLQTAKDVGIGALKGLGGTVAGLGELAANSGMLPGVAPAALDENMRNPAFRKAEAVTTASNDAQRAGKVVEGVAEMALPTGAAVKAIPRASRAARVFQQVAEKAKGVPVNVEAPGQVALRIQQLADRGGTMPRMVRQFLQRTTDPNQAAMTFDEGRDFYSNISRLSADEFNRLTAPIQREVGNMRVALNDSLKNAAGTVGHADDYARAMREYASAAKVNSLKSAMVDALRRGALPMAGAAGAAYWLGSKARNAVGSMFEE